MKDFGEEIQSLRVPLGGSLMSGSGGSGDMDDRRPVDVLCPVTVIHTSCDFPSLGRDEDPQQAWVRVCFWDQRAGIYCLRPDIIHSFRKGITFFWSLQLRMNRGALLRFILNKAKEPWKQQPLTPAGRARHFLENLTLPEKMPSLGNSVSSQYLSFIGDLWEGEGGGGQSCPYSMNNLSCWK